MGKRVIDVEFDAGQRRTVRLADMTAGLPLPNDFPVKYTNTTCRSLALCTGNKSANHLNLIS